MNADKRNEVQNAVRKMSPKATDSEIDSIIDGDWPNAQEHSEWLNTASVKEIADWVDGIWVNMCEDVDYSN